jgi:hypothetical protein
MKARVDVADKEAARAAAAREAAGVLGRVPVEWRLEVAARDNT